MAQAYQRLGESDVPKFTVIVAQKNHHTKLFQAMGPENVPAGKKCFLFFFSHTTIPFISRTISS